MCTELHQISQYLCIAVIAYSAISNNFIVPESVTCRPKTKEYQHAPG
jgi:hypothetical protein